MACGVHLGILLICLVQAEHVRCLWATQAQSSQRQNGNRYVGFSQQDGGLRRLGGSDSQNQFRQASISLGSDWRSSLNPRTAVSSGYNQGLSSSSYTHGVSQPAQSGYSSVRLVQSSSVSKPNWRVKNTEEVNVQKVPKKQFLGLSTSIASGSSVSRHSQNQNDVSDIGKRRTWPVQQGTQSTGQYLSGTPASVQRPSTERDSFSSASHQAAAQKHPSAAAKPRAYYGQRGFSQSKKSSSLFSAGESQAQMQTSVSVPARRVSSHRGTAASKPSLVSFTQNDRTRNDPPKTEAGKVYRSKLFPVTGGSAEGSYRPTSHMASRHATHTQSLPAPYKQNAPVSFEPRSLKMATSQRFNNKHTSAEQAPSSASSVQAPWDSRNPAQGARNLPTSRSSSSRSSSGVGTSPQRFAPSRIHNIPQSFGGYAIRRLKEPVDQKEVGVQKPQEAYTSPPRQAASHQSQGQGVHQKSKWTRIKLHQGY
ncbi:serine-rich adhesin for platelets-like [Toxotes jaculatrix]|uniref:serine-rich adhesin for platelets-like n=1 Tax=Toxotes jaculatrix TaxID=941984 RepID=UPI001B3B0EB7|nr:serine-rich adhesin for platelets-like [Toxotes jaculatrix]